MKCFLLAPNGCLFFFSPAAFFPASHVILRGFWQCSIKPIPLLICWHYLSPRSSVPTASVPLRQMCCDEDELQERGEQHNTFFFQCKKEEDQQSAVELLLAANSRLCFPVLLNLSATNENKDEHFACLLLESFIVLSSPGHRELSWVLPEAHSLFCWPQRSWLRNRNFQYCTAEDE